MIGRDDDPIGADGELIALVAAALDGPDAEVNHPGNWSGRGVHAGRRGRGGQPDEVGEIPADPRGVLVPGRDTHHRVRGDHEVATARRLDGHRRRNERVSGTW